jgi:hypothetical protein
MHLSCLLLTILCLCSLILALPILVPRRVPADPATPDLAHASILGRPDPPDVNHHWAETRHQVIQQFKDRVHAIAWIFGTMHDIEWAPVNHNTAVMKPYPMPRPLEDARGEKIMEERARRDRAQQWKGKWWHKDPFIGFESENIADHLTPEARKAALDEEFAAKEKKRVAKAAKKKAKQEKKRRKKERKQKKKHDKYMKKLREHDLDTSFTNPMASLEGKDKLKSDPEFRKPGYK